MMTLTGHWENLVLNMVEVQGKTFFECLFQSIMVSPKEVNCSVVVSEKAVNVDNLYAGNFSTRVFHFCLTYLAHAVCIMRKPNSLT